MADLLEQIAALSQEDRAGYWSSLSSQERQVLDDRLTRALGSKFGAYRYDPIAFVNECLGEPTWSKMAAILDSVLRYKITCVPAGHSVSKSHTAARVASWWVSVHPPGTALVITTATTFQQVKTILWPHIRNTPRYFMLTGFFANAVVVRVRYSRLLERCRSARASCDVAAYSTSFARCR